MMLLSSCLTRSIHHSHIKHNLIEIDFVRQVSGFTKQKLGYEHPAFISKERLVHILSALEIEARQKKGGVIRQPAIHPDIVDQTAEALSKAFKEVGPDEAIGVYSIRKQMRIGILHFKYLTSFLAHIKDGHLYLSIRRVEWLVPKGREDDAYPPLRRDKKPMNFRVVTGDPIYFAGTQDLEIDWQNDVFRKDFRLPGTTSGEKRRREVLLQSPIPKDELEALQKDAIPYTELTPDQLRALADLEEQRREGTITENAYQRSKRQLLRPR